MDTHALKRTNPKGQSFIGVCTKCGKDNLPSSAVTEECPNPAGIGKDEALLNAIRGHN